ncbi:hypothetical protein NIES2100_04980 [Calothrix sp. NIES-2100]|uniref:hypothetical protein n=1 Tax=Calothrix sp. NIES-2100 TaxID=1954172 RepID=UPI000B609645|nr:hypothetical protein NIES2100_04980 [Calothrix sp. NIES-2100]
MLLQESKTVIIPDSFIPDLVIYHNVVEDFACPDGFAASWVCYRKYSEINPDLEYVGWTYDKANQGIIPDLTNYKNILVVDFSFKPAFLNYWKERGKAIYVIDHHEGFLETVKKSSYTLDNLIFDDQECGATLTWKTLYPGQPIPKLLQYVRDRDLFIKQLQYCDEVFSGLSKLRRSFNLFDQLLELENIDFQLVLDFLVPYGEPSVLKKREKIQIYLNRVEFYGDIPVVKLNKSDIALKSDLGEVLSSYYPFSKFVVIINKGQPEHIRIRSSIYTYNTNLIELFSDIESISGLKNAANFKWYGSDQGLKDLIVQKSV